MDENKEFVENDGELEEGLVVLIDEEDHEHTFQVLERIELNGQEYAILVPWDEKEDDSAIPLKIVVENGEELLYDIDDDDEWDAIVDFWNDYVDENED
ncbi:MAG: DUF1292 domain-containing protein [Peptococcaceae bacterium]|nr:DUF1292 domain-containing protein [Peptococcaceae bacterium]